MSVLARFTRIWCCAGFIFSAGVVRLGAGQDPEADIRAGQYARALARLAPAARAGDPRSQFLLAALYLHGNGVAKDTDVAVQWLERSAGQGYAPAQSDLGGLLLEGRNVARDTTRALNLLLKAAAQQDSGAFYNLGVMYRDGLGVAEDREKCRRYFLAAAEKGYALAQYGIGQLSFEDKDFMRSAYWYQKAGNQGDLEALYNLGYMYHEGLGVEKDYRRANELFLTIARQGRFDEERRATKALDMLGNSYRKGEGVPRDYVEAYKWYLLAASQGHPDAPSQMRLLEPFLAAEQIADAKRRAEAFAKGN
jgi:TPR repeat protein